MKKETSNNIAFKNYSLFFGDFETSKSIELSTQMLYLINLIGDDPITPRDTETPDMNPMDTQGGAVILSGMWNINTNEYNLEYENLEDTFNYYANSTRKEKHDKAIIWYHNLAFDGSYILRWLLIKGYTQFIKLKKYDDIPDYKFCLFYSGGRFFSITFIWNGIELIFRDSLKLFPLALKTIGKAVGLDKLGDSLKIDYNLFKLDIEHNYPTHWLEYLKRDCEIMPKMLKSFWTAEPLSKNVKYQTIGSVSYAKVHGKIKEFTPDITYTKYQYYFKWYRGGLCFPNMKLIGKWVNQKNSTQKIKMIDKRSMYPSVMIDLLPIGIDSLNINPTWQNWTDFMEIKIIHARIKKEYENSAWIPEPCRFDGLKRVYKQEISVKKGKVKLPNPFEYLQNIENQTVYFIKEEWEYILKLYDIEYNVVSHRYFELKQYLRDEIVDLYEKKKEAKLAGDKVRELVYKLMLNNIYGKTGQRPTRTQIFYGPEANIPDEYRLLSKRKDEYESYNIEKKIMAETKCRPVHLASYITAMARVKLIKKYLEIQNKGGEFLYCDTDSIVYIDSKTGIKFDDIGMELEHWGVETNKDNKPIAGDYFISLSPKQYRIVENKSVVKFACAGISREVMEQVKNQDYNYELGENPLYSDIFKKTQLKQGKFGKFIANKTPFSFRKWKYYISKVICPDELLEKGD